MTEVQHRIVTELHTALAAIRIIPPRLLNVIGCWGDTLTDEQVLDMLRRWNETGDIEPNGRLN